MSQDSVAARAKKVACEKLRIPLDRQSDELEIGDIPEWDSLGHVNLLQAAEALIATILT